MKKFLICAFIGVLVLFSNLHVFAQDEVLLSKDMPPVEELSKQYGMNLAEYPYYTVMSNIYTSSKDGLEYVNWFIMFSKDPTSPVYLGGGNFEYSNDNGRTFILHFQTPLNNTTSISNVSGCYKEGVAFGADISVLYCNFNVLLHDKNTGNSSVVMFYNPYRGGSSGSYWNNFVNPSSGSSGTDDDNSGILSWLSNIFDMLSDGFSNLGEKIGSGFANLINSISSLPTLIWNVFQSGFEFLFVPDEDFIKENFSSWQQLFSDRFGAVYQAYDYLFGFVKKFVYQEAATHVTFPTVTVPLSGSEFTFGGYDVQLIPDGFSGIVEILKGLIDLVCTISFVNVLKSKFVELLGGYQDAN